MIRNEIDSDRDEMNREIRIMRNLKHANIVEYVDYLKYDHLTDILIMEFCQVNKIYLFE